MKITLHKARIFLFTAGLVSLLFGLIIFSFPSLPLLTMILLFAAYMLLKGLALAIGAWRTKLNDKHWLFLLFYGVLNIITGIVAYAWPQPTLFLFGFIVSINLLLGGIIQLVMAIYLHREIKEAGWLVFSGAVTLIAGIYIYLIERIEPATILNLIALSALLISVFFISISLRTRFWKDKTVVHL